MGNGNFKIGDRVVVSERYGLSTQRLKGKTGTVIEKSSWLGIEFDEFINGHSCSGRGKDGYCYRVPAGDVDCISEGRSVVVIHRNNRETIATLKDGKTILKTAKATCDPSDTFNAEFGRALALARLNDDQKMIDFLLKGEEKPFVPTQSRIVKQDKYEVGDKVKIIDNWVHGCHQDSDGKMDKWLGKMMTVRQVNVSDYKMSEDKEDSFWGNGWAWNALCIEGKVIEETTPSGQPVTAPIFSETPLYKVGDLVTVVARNCNHEFEIGEIVRVKRMMSETNVDTCEKLDKSDWWCVYNSDIAPIKPPIITPFDWEGFKSGKFAVNCDTEEKAKQFFDELKMQGIKWNSGDTLEEIGTHWNQNQGDTCYGFTDQSDRGICFGIFSDKNHIPYTPNYREVKRPAKVGEWIKVVNAQPIYTQHYKTGDILHVTALTGYQSADVKVSGIDDSYIDYQEYVVLEPITHSIETVANTEPQYIEVKRQAKTGEKVKIINTRQVPVTDGKPDYKIGDILEIIEEGYKVRYAEGTGDNGNMRVLLPDEYVVLEPVAEVSRRLEK